MSLRDAIQMGIQISQNGDLQRIRDAENARAQAIADRQDAEYRNLEEARGQFSRDWSNPESEFTFGKKAVMPDGPVQATDAQGVYRPSMDSQAANPTYVDNKLALPQGYGDQSKQMAALAKVASAKDLYAMQQEQQKLKTFAQGQAIANYVRSASPEELAHLAEDISGDQRNSLKAVQGKKGSWTLDLNGEKAKLSKEQVADFLSAQHVYKNTGDESARKRMDDIHKGLADAITANNTAEEKRAQIGNQAFTAESTDAYHRGALANDSARLGIAREAAKNKVREMSPETVQRLNDLSTQISEERDPQKRQVLMNQFNREYAVGATQMGKVIMPKSGKEDNGFGAIAQKIIEGGGDAKAVETARTAWKAARGDAPDEVITAWVDGKDPSTGKPLSAAERNIMVTKWPSLREVGAVAGPGTAEAATGEKGVDAAQLGVKMPGKLSTANVQVLSPAGEQPKMFGLRPSEPMYNIRLPDGSTNRVSAAMLEAMGFPITEQANGVKRYVPTYAQPTSNR